MLLELLLGLVALLFVWDYVNKKHRNAILEESCIPGPKALPILGNAMDVRHINSDNLLDAIHDLKRKYGKIYRLWVLHQLSVVILDPKYLEVILTSQEMLKKSKLYDFMVGWLGNGLITSWGKKWHARRKIITPAFHFRILEQFVEIFDQQSSVMIKKLYGKADGKTALDIFPVVRLCALDIIAENPGLEYVHAIESLSAIVADRVIKPLQRTDFLFRLTAPKQYQESQRCIKILHKFTIDVIEQRRATLVESLKHNSVRTETEDFELNAKKRMFFLDVLLQSKVNGVPLTNEDIREEVDTFMTAGHDTTATGIAFTLYLIARHPRVQEKLVEEIKQVLGSDKNKPVTLNELQDLKYMELVLKESLRLYPVVSVIGRDIQEDVKLGDITIPAYTNISISLFMLMHDPDYFTKPNHFIPERFENMSDENINSFVFIPFSAGPRNCIGQKFAMLEMKSMVSKVLRHFELSPLGPDVELVISIILRSKTGMRVGLKPRDFQH